MSQISSSISNSSESDAIQYASDAKFSKDLEEFVKKSINDTYRKRCNRVDDRIRSVLTSLSKINGNVNKMHEEVKCKVQRYGEFSMRNFQKISEQISHNQWKRTSQNVSKSKRDYLTNSGARIQKSVSDGRILYTVSLPGHLISDQHLLGPRLSRAQQTSIDTPTEKKWKQESRRSRTSALPTRLTASEARRKSFEASQNISPKPKYNETSSDQFESTRDSKMEKHTKPIDRYSSKPGSVTVSNFKDSRTRLLTTSPTFKNKAQKKNLNQPRNRSSTKLLQVAKTIDAHTGNVKQEKTETESYPKSLARSTSLKPEKDSVLQEKVIKTEPAYTNVKEPIHDLSPATSKNNIKKPMVKVSQPSVQPISRSSSKLISASSDLKVVEQQPTSPEKSQKIEPSKPKIELNKPYLSQPKSEERSKHKEGTTPATPIIEKKVQTHPKLPDSPIPEMKNTEPMPPSKAPPKTVEISMSTRKPISAPSTKNTEPKPTSPEKSQQIEHISKHGAEPTMPDLIHPQRKEPPIARKEKKTRIDSEIPLKTTPVSPIEEKTTHLHPKKDQGSSKPESKIVKPRSPTESPPKSIDIPTSISKPTTSPSDSKIVQQKRTSSKKPLHVEPAPEPRTELTKPSLSQPKHKKPTAPEKAKKSKMHSETPLQSTTAKRIEKKLQQQPQLEDLSQTRRKTTEPTSTYKSPSRPVVVTRSKSISTPLDSQFVKPKRSDSGKPLHAEPTSKPRTEPTKHKRSQPKREEPAAPEKDKKSKMYPQIPLEATTAIPTIEKTTEQKPKTEDGVKPRREVSEPITASESQQKPIGISKSPSKPISAPSESINAEPKKPTSSEKSQKVEPTSKPKKETMKPDKPTKRVSQPKVETKKEIDEKKDKTVPAHRISVPKSEEVGKPKDDYVLKSDSPERPMSESEIPPKTIPKPKSLSRIKDGIFEKKSEEPKISKSPSKPISAPSESINAEPKKPTSSEKSQKVEPTSKPKKDTIKPDKPTKRVSQPKVEAKKEIDEKKDKTVPAHRISVPKSEEVGKPKDDYVLKSSSPERPKSESQILTKAIPKPKSFSRIKDGISEKKSEEPEEQTKPHKKVDDSPIESMPVSKPLEKVKKPQTSLSPVKEIGKLKSPEIPSTIAATHKPSEKQITEPANETKKESLMPINTPKSQMRPTSTEETKAIPQSPLKSKPHKTVDDFPIQSKPSEKLRAPSPIKDIGKIKSPEMPSTPGSLHPPSQKPFHPMIEPAPKRESGDSKSPKRPTTPGIEPKTIPQSPTKSHKKGEDFTIPQSLTRSHKKREDFPIESAPKTKPSEKLETPQATFSPMEGIGKLKSPVIPSTPGALHKEPEKPASEPQQEIVKPTTITKSPTGPPSEKRRIPKTISTLSPIEENEKDRSPVIPSTSPSQKPVPPIAEAPSKTTKDSSEPPTTSRRIPQSPLKAGPHKRIEDFPVIKPSEKLETPQATLSPPERIGKLDSPVIPSTPDQLRKELKKPASEPQKEIVKPTTTTTKSPTRAPSTKDPKTIPSSPLNTKPYKKEEEFPSESKPVSKPSEKKRIPQTISTLTPIEEIGKDRSPVIPSPSQKSLQPIAEAPSKIRKESAEPPTTPKSSRRPTSTKVPRKIPESPLKDEPLKWLEHFPLSSTPIIKPPAKGRAPQIDSTMSPISLTTSPLHPISQKPVQPIVEPTSKTKRKSGEPTTTPKSPEKPTSPSKVPQPKSPEKVKRRRSGTPPKYKEPKIKLKSPPKEKPKPIKALHTTPSEMPHFEKVEHPMFELGPVPGMRIPEPKSDAPGKPKDVVGPRKENIEPMKFDSWEKPKIHQKPEPKTIVAPKKEIVEPTKSDFPEKLFHPKIEPVLGHKKEQKPTKIHGDTPHLFETTSKSSQIEIEVGPSKPKSYKPSELGQKRSEKPTRMSASSQHVFETSSKSSQIDIDIETSKRRSFKQGNVIETTVSRTSITSVEIKRTSRTSIKNEPFTSKVFIPVSTEKPKPRTSETFEFQRPSTQMPSKQDGRQSRSSKILQLPSDPKKYRSRTILLHTSSEQFKPPEPVSRDPKAAKTADHTFKAPEPATSKVVTTPVTPVSTIPVSTIPASTTPASTSPEEKPESGVFKSTTAITFTRSTQRVPLRRVLPRSRAGTDKNRLQNVSNEKKGAHRIIADSYEEVLSKFPENIKSILTKFQK